MTKFFLILSKLKSQFSHVIKNKSVLTIFFSIVLVSAVMFLANSIAFNIILSYSDKQIKEKDYISFQNTVKSFDHRFNQINDVFTTLELLDNNSRLNNNMNQVFAYEILKDLNKIVSINDYIHEIVLFFNDTNLVVTSQGTSNLDNFFDKQYYSYKYSVGFWKSQFQTKHSIKVIPSTQFFNRYETIAEKPKNLIAVLNSNLIGNSKLNELIFIDVDKLLEKTLYDNSISDTTFFIMDDDNNIIMTTDSESDFENVKSAFDQSNNKSISINDYDYHLINSSYNKFKYVKKVPQQTPMLDKAIFTNRLIMIIAGIIEIILALFVTVVLYRPVKKIIGLFDTSNSNHNDAFYYITSKVSELKQEYDDLERNIKTLELEANNSMLLKSITGLKELKNPKEGNNLNALLESKNFIMLSFDIFSTKSNSLVFTTEIELLAVEIYDNLSNHFSHFKIFQEEDNKFICIIGDNSLEDKQAFLSRLRSISDALKSEDLKRYNIIINTSSIYSDFNDYHNSYNDIRTCRKKRLMKISSGIVNIEDIQNLKEVDISIPSDFKDKTISFILEGDFTKCVKEVEKILLKNIENGVYYTQFISVSSIILNNIREAFIFCGYDVKVDNIMQRCWYKINEQMVNYDVLLNIFNDLALEVNSFIKVSQKNKLNKTFIAQYINLHYMEDIYLDTMAEIVGTSPKYFSKFFKKEFGINFVEFLNNIRIFHAKQFLKDDSITVSAVGTKVGYNNPSTFASTFKKVCGISPKEYREQYLKLQ